jgi:NTE family protein
MAVGLLPKLSWAADRSNQRAGQTPSIAVCFSSGALHGYAHVGAIRAFQALGLKPDVITGTSVGAIAGVLWAAGYDADAIEAIADDPNWHEASGLRIPVLGIGKLDGLRDMIDRHAGGKSIETLPTRFAAVATDLDSGQAVTLDRGPAGQAVAASSSVPIRYEPVTIDRRRLIDGALSAPVPVDAARALGAEFTIAIDVAFRPYEEPVSGITGVAFQIFHIMVNRLIDEQIKRVDFPIRLDLHQTMRGEGGIPALIRAGEEAVYGRWPELQRALSGA